MASSAPRLATGPPVPARGGRHVSRWCARLVLVGIVLDLAVRGVPSGSSTLLVGGSMPAGSAVVLGLIASAVLAAVHDREAVARAATAASLLLAATLTAVALLTLTAVTGDAVTAADVAGWRPTGHAATVHLLLGAALYGTLRPSRRLGIPRAIGLVVGALAPLVSLSVHAARGEGYALLPGVPPMSAALAVTTLLATLAVAGLAPDRWPTRVLLRHPSDRALVGRLLPFVLLIPFVAPVVVALARALGVDERATVVFATLLPMLGLAGLLAVTVRGHRRLVDRIEVQTRQLVTILDGLPIAVMVRGQDGTLLHLNPGAEAFVARLGVDVDAIRGSASDLMAHVEVVDEDERPYDRELLPVVAAIRDGRSHDATVGHALPEGGYAWYSVRAAPAPLSDGSTGTLVTLDDVTEQHEGRLRLAVAERSARETFEHAPIGVAVLSPGGELLRANAALCDLLGYPDEQHLAAAGVAAALLTDDPGDPPVACWRTYRTIPNGYVSNGSCRTTAGTCCPPSCRSPSSATIATGPATSSCRSSTSASGAPSRPNFAPRPPTTR